MARLYNAVDGSHLFIRAGQNQGTLQIYPEGVAWLKLHHHIPKKGEDIYLDPGTLYRLRNEGYLFIHGIPYDHGSKSETFDVDQILARIAGGLPLLLQLKEQNEPAWELYLDLSELNEEVWEELRSHHTDFITASNALPISRRQLIYAHGLLRVYPFPHPYQIFSNNSDNNNQLLQQAPETPGLNDNWQGNIFLERATQAGTWQRCASGSTVSFSGELLWLAKPDFKLDWPGQAARVGNPYVGWQLWRLTVNESAPVSWESIQNWFKYRSIDVAPRPQRLEIVSLPSAVTEDGQYIIEPGKSIWIVCYPPSRHTHGIFREIALSAEQLPSPAHNSNPPSKSISASYPADRVNYFWWSAGQPGEYRIRVQGDASGEPLLVQVDTIPITRPQWLCGLSCTAMSPEYQHTFYAFNDFVDSDEELYLLNQFAKQELAALTWTYRPEGLPVYISWGYIPSNGLQQHVSNYPIQSGEELTRCWREQICPALASDSRTKVTLDGGSYGCIELSITLPQQQPVEPAWWTDERLVSQCIWLSRMTGEKLRQKPVFMPMHLREPLRQLSVQTDINTTLRAALERLASANIVPAWVLFRLRILIAEVENMGQNPFQGR